MLGTIDSQALRAYVVWLPILQHDNEGEAALASATMVDPRASHFWNPDSGIARAASKAMGITAQLDAAWDVFLIYGPDVVWKAGEPMPAPTAWMHRLAEQDPRWMEPRAMARAVRALLPEKPAAPPAKGAAPRPSPPPKAPAAKPTAAPPR